MTKQIVTIVLGAAVMLGTATTLFAQNGNAVGGGAAGGPTVSIRTRTDTTVTTRIVRWYIESSVKHLSKRRLMSGLCAPDSAGHPMLANGNKPSQTSIRT
jgi:hypothetical protein